MDIVCYGCGKPIEDLDNRHEDEDGYSYHPECCPECAAYEEEEDDTGLYQCLCEDMVGHIGKCPVCGGQLIFWMRE